MNKMGNKTLARNIAIENKIPVIPGSESTIDDQQQAVEVAHKIGYPCLDKSVIWWWWTWYESCP